MKFIRTVLISTIAIALLAWALPSVSYQNLATLFLASLTLSLLQKIVRPILKILFLPINLVTLGLFSWVINVFILWLATFLVPGLKILPMTISGVNLGQFLSLLLISFAISVIQSFLSKIIK
ncbi:MAG: hypothetical protein GF381_03485 [Candidatus Pacebacteria bacterium]|nr:hypothetical protein [Candidatus Paceibacterota bacterium]